MVNCNCVKENYGGTCHRCIEGERKLYKYYIDPIEEEFVLLTGP